MKRKALLVLIIWLMGIVLLFGCQSKNAHPVGFVKAAESEDGYATVYVPDNRDAKVLLLADPQLDPTEKYSIIGSHNELTIVFLNKFLDATTPDLVIIAGDVVMTAVLNNWSYFCQIADIFEAKQIPWSFTFGNHDCENEFISETADTDSALRQLTKPKLIEEVQAKYTYCLIYSGECKDGYGNHIVNVRNTKGKLLNTFCNLDCTYDEVDGYSHVITQAQTDFYANAIETLSEKEGKTISSIVVTHVALPEMFIGYKEAKAGTGESTYYYGELLGGDYSRYADKSTFFDTMLRLNSTKSVFFGHHHENDASIEYKGIRLTFIQHSGMSHEYRVDHSKNFVLYWPMDTVFDFTDVDLYGDRRGGTMVTVKQDATYSFAPIYAADVIPDYKEWAVDYEAVAQAIIQERGAQYVIRGK